jgi:hypothetical protein
MQFATSKKRKREVNVSLNHCQASPKNKWLKEMFPFFYMSSTGEHDE